MKLSMHINQSLFGKMLFIAMLFISLPASSSQQDISNKVKAAYVFNFIKYIEWPDEKNIENFNIAYYGNEKGYWNALQEMQGLKVKHFNINVVKITSLNQTGMLQILILDNEKSSNIKMFSNQLNEQATLIISENASDKKFTMINFIQTNEKTIKFELNRYQMLNVNLRVSTDILVLGGSEIDIVNLLNEMNATITKSSTEIKQQSERLKQLKSNITSREKQLTLQQEKIEHQEEKFNTQSNKLKKQDDELDQNKTDIQALQNNVKEVNQELDISLRQLKSNKTSLLNLKHDIKQKENAINSLEWKISEKKQSLKTLEDQQATQELEIAQQSNVIQAQYIILIIAGIVSLAILFILLIIYRSKKIQHKINLELEINMKALAEANLRLSNTQDQLVESEKMAALGGLVAGIAHEINTPLGVSVTAASHLADQVDLFEKEYNNGILKKSSLEELLLDAKELSGILIRNLRRGSELISNFKQIAVDQSCESRREFELHSYTEELIQSLRPQFKQNNHSVRVISNDKIELNNFPGVIAQIITNLIMNSLNHGYKNTTDGEITITIAIENNNVVIDYRDKGIGLTEQQRKKVFEPFYTTARSTGGSGLGMSISYNLITSKLKGTIKCLESSEGAHFLIIFPQ